MDSKERTCCFTGHRTICPDQYPDIQKRLASQVEQLILQGVCVFAAGGAIGFDTLAAEVVLELRNKYPQIKLILVLPCAGKVSPKREQIMAQADEVRVLAAQYHAGCMQVRNRYLVEHADYCLCYRVKDTGGTAYTAEYAMKKGLNMIMV